MSQLPLEFPNVLLCNVCITHSLNQHIPCGRLGAFATTPSGQPILHYFFIIQRMGTDARIYCVLVKPQSFKDCLCFACSFSAYMYSKEHEMVCVTCREREIVSSLQQNFLQVVDDHAKQSLSITMSAACTSTHAPPPSPHVIQ